MAQPHHLLPMLSRKYFWTSWRRCPLSNYAWLLLFAGIAIEIVGTTGMKALAADHPALSLCSATAGIVCSYFLVSRAMEKIPVALAYAVWSGVGLAGISLLSWCFFAEPMPPLKLAGIAFVIWGMIVINLNRSGKKRG